MTQNKTETLVFQFGG